MGWYGTLLIARPVAASLPAQPEVRRAFGSRFLMPGMWSNDESLHGLGGGWQRVGVSAFYSERVRLAQGVEDLVVVTGAPAIAAYVSESSCAHVEGRTPSGLAFSIHLPNTDRQCGYEHIDGRPGLVDHRAAVDAVLAWAQEAGRQPSADAVARVLDTSWECESSMEDEVFALFTALGFTSTGLIRPTVDPSDPAFDELDSKVITANAKASTLIHAAERGIALSPEWALTEQEREFLEFRGLLWGSVYGGSLTKDELVARYEQLRARWKQ